MDHRGDPQRVSFIIVVVWAFRVFVFTKSGTAQNKIMKRNLFFIRETEGPSLFLKSPSSQTKASLKNTLPGAQAVKNHVMAVNATLSHSLPGDTLHIDFPL